MRIEPPSRPSRPAGLARGIPLALALAVVGLAGCASSPADAPAPPTADTALRFRLPPSTLARPLAWQQRLQATVQGRAQPPLDALLEADETAVRLALVGPGQTLARLTWDGRQLQVERGRGWPDAVPPERVLSDLQLALWPLAALQSALPPDATLREDGPWRELRRGGTLLARVRDAGSAHIELVNPVDGYALRIDSVPLTGEPPR